MAKYVADHLSYYLSVAATQRDNLASLRHWSHLKMGVDGHQIWLKDFSSKELASNAIRMIPGKQLYYEKDGKLFLLESLLPSRGVPPLLWTAINRALPLSLPASQTSLAALPEKLQIKLVPTDTEQQATAMVLPTELLGNYLSGAPAIRMQRIHWAIIEPNIAFLTGFPLLPIPADVYWQRDNFLFPAGYALEYPLLIDTLVSMIDPESKHWILWNKDGSFVGINKQQLVGLSLSSFRKTSEHRREV